MTTYAVYLGVVDLQRAEGDDDRDAAETERRVDLFLTAVLPAG